MARHLSMVNISSLGKSIDMVVHKLKYRFLGWGSFKPVFQAKSFNRKEIAYNLDWNDGLVTLCVK